MKLKLTLGIVVTALAFGSVAAEARPLHPHHHRVLYHHVLYHHARYRRLRYPHVSYHDVSRRSDRLITLPSSTLRGLVARIAAENGVPYSLANAVVTIESRYNPHVSNGSALGLMQIKAQTARGLGFRGAAAGLFDPSVNVRYGMRYLALAYRESRGDLCATVMRYQSGIAARRLSAANRAYCARAHRLMGHA